MTERMLFPSCIKSNASLILSDGRVWVIIGLTLISNLSDDEIGRSQELGHVKLLRIDIDSNETALRQCSIYPGFRS